MRADGRNTPGADVPFAFDSGAALTIAGGGTATLGFEIVRHVAKEESPPGLPVEVDVAGLDQVAKLDHTILGPEAIFIAGVS